MVPDLARSIKLEAQVLLHRRPFAVDDAEDHRVALRPVSGNLVIAQHAVLLRAKTRDRGARGVVEPVRAELDRDALESLESVRKQQQLTLGVDRPALDPPRIPGVPDLQAAVGRVDVEITRAAHDLA